MMATVLDATGTYAPNQLLPILVGAGPAILSDLSEWSMKVTANMGVVEDHDVLSALTHSILPKYGVTGIRGKPGETTQYAGTIHAERTWTTRNGGAGSRVDV